VDYGCRVIGLFDGANAPRGVDAALNHDSDFPKS
jgi:hypothetical protein